MSSSRSLNRATRRPDLSADARPSDIAALPDLAHSRAETGPVRHERPVYVDLLPPCNAACPAGENIQGWLAHVKAGEHERAWRTLVADNPLPAIHGRVCYHPCETGCNRAGLDEAVSIHAVERFLGDLALQNGWQVQPPAARSGKRVLVIGAGPSGLSAAHHLARRGHEVEVRDAGEQPGGMMRYGIPAYRLPRDVLDAELERLTALGVRFVCEHRVTDLQAERREGRFDAVFVAVGAHIARHTEIPAVDAVPMVDAISFLGDVAAGSEPAIGRRVAIYGAGNTAMDVSRTARRLGAEEATVIFISTREDMPAHEQEARDAEREGVRINWLRSIHAVQGEQLQVEVMERDDEGGLHPTGRFETLAADTVILALGQEADTTFLRSVPGVQFESDGTVRVSDSLMTGAAGVFAGGDMVPSQRTVTVAVGHGKRAAAEIDAWLRGERLARAPKHPQADLELLNLWYFGDADSRPQPTLDPSQRLAGFGEIVGGLSGTDAAFEARRCLSCGNCIECDGCLGACPEDAVIKLGTGLRYEFDYDRCTGCRACFTQCPVHSIEMISEDAPLPSNAFVAPGSA